MLPLLVARRALASVAPRVLPAPVGVRMLSMTPRRADEADAAPAPAYPFARHVVTRAHAVQPADTLRSPSPAVKHSSRAIMPRVDAQLTSELDPNEDIAKLFSRRSPDCVLPGSVLMVETYLSPARTSATTFSGVLIAVRRAGVATTFVLRTIAAKLGVEMRFHAYSPMIKSIKVIQRADAKKGEPGLRRARRAKLYYMRRSEDRRVNSVAGIMKQHRAAEVQRTAAQAQASPKKN